MLLPLGPVAGDISGTEALGTLSNAMVLQPPAPMPRKSQAVSSWRHTLPGLLAGQSGTGLLPGPSSLGLLPGNQPLSSCQPLGWPSCCSPSTGPSWSARPGRLASRLSLLASHSAKMFPSLAPELHTYLASVSRVSQAWAS